MAGAYAVGDDADCGKRGIINVWLLYRRISSIGKITVSLWIGTLLTTGAVIATGAMNFDAKLAFDFPPGAFDFSLCFPSLVVVVEALAICLKQDC